LSHARMSRVCCVTRWTGECVGGAAEAAAAAAAAAVSWGRDGVKRADGEADGPLTACGSRLVLSARSRAEALCGSRLLEAPLPLFVSAAESDAAAFAAAAATTAAEGAAGIVDVDAATDDWLGGNAAAGDGVPRPPDRRPGLLARPGLLERLWRPGLFAREEEEEDNLSPVAPLLPLLLLLLMGEERPMVCCQCCRVSPRHIRSCRFCSIALIGDRTATPAGDQPGRTRNFCAVGGSACLRMRRRRGDFRSRSGVCRRCALVLLFFTFWAQRDPVPKVPAGEAERVPRVAGGVLLLAPPPPPADRLEGRVDSRPFETPPMLMSTLPLLDTCTRVSEFRPGGTWIGCRREMPSIF